MKVVIKSTSGDLEEYRSVLKGFQLETTETNENIIQIASIEQIFYLSRKLGWYIIVRHDMKLEIYDEFRE